jgi:DNA-binding FadR family transcriptional regulator
VETGRRRRGRRHLVALPGRRGGPESPALGQRRPAAERLAELASQLERAADDIHPAGAPSPSLPTLSAWATWAGALRSAAHLLRWDAATQDAAGNADRHVQAARRRAEVALGDGPADAGNDQTLISVRRGSRGGARVVAPDASVAARYVGLLLQMQGATINDVYEAWMISEPPCARLLATDHTNEDIEKLTQVVNELKAEIAAKKSFIPDPYVWSSLTYRFHELILEGCGNKTMAIQGAVLQDIVATHVRTRIAHRDDSDTDERPAGHPRDTRLISLVKAGNASGAEKHWRSHM